MKISLGQIHRLLHRIAIMLISDMIGTNSIDVDLEQKLITGTRRRH
jgi:hypothetical protein